MAETRAHDGGPAYPSHFTQEFAGTPDEKQCEPASYGMSLRDHFAGLAMNGLLANGGMPVEPWATTAYKVADAMLVQRNAIDITITASPRVTSHGVAQAEVKQQSEHVTNDELIKSIDRMKDEADEQQVRLQQRIAALKSDADEWANAYSSLCRIVHKHLDPLGLDPLASIEDVDAKLGQVVGTDTPPDRCGSEHLDVLNRMSSEGGSFVRVLADTWRWADYANHQVLYKAFGHYWRKYATVTVERNGGAA